MGDRPSPIVQCDHCGAHGRRRENHPCPDFWFYLESIDRTQPRSKQRIYIVWACSEARRDALWKPGPGPDSIDEGGTKRYRERQASKEPA